MITFTKKKVHHLFLSINNALLSADYATLHEANIFNLIHRSFYWPTKKPNSLKDYSKLKFPLESKLIQALNITVAILESWVWLAWMNKKNIYTLWLKSTGNVEKYLHFLYITKYILNMTRWFICYKSELFAL